MLTASLYSPLEKFLLGRPVEAQPYTKFYSSKIGADTPELPRGRKRRLKFSVRSNNFCVFATSAVSYS